MTDAEFIARLESCRLREDEFDHAAHVRAGYQYLRNHKVPAGAGAHVCGDRGVRGVGRPGGPLPRNNDDWLHGADP